MLWRWDKKTTRTIKFVRPARFLLSSSIGRFCSLLAMEDYWASFLWKAWINSDAEPTSETSFILSELISLFRPRWSAPIDLSCSEMGKNQAYKAMQRARLSGSGGSEEVDDGMVRSFPHHWPNFMGSFLFLLVQFLCTILTFFGLNN